MYTQNTIEANTKGCIPLFPRKMTSEWLLANTPDQTESLLHSLQNTALNIGQYVNADKAVFTRLKREGIMFTFGSIAEIS